MSALALDLALKSTWAMQPQALEELLEIAARANEPTVEALEAYRAKSLARAERAGARNGVAIIDAIGPLFKRANLFTSISGATSYDLLRRDLQAALDDPKIKAILLNIDSPGGEANGTNELAQAVFDARGVKPIVAYVGGTAASAAYWLASAADRVIIDPMAILGSIGVQASYTVRDPKPGEKAYRFVSSQSPNKNPPLGTDTASKQIQSTVDAMAQVFVDAVAKHRGVSSAKVSSDFGSGGVFVGNAAITAGMADSLGSFESTLADLAAGRTAPEIKRIHMIGRTEPLAAASPENERVAKLSTIAAGLQASAEDLTAAIVGGTSPTAFALAQADKAASARELEAIVAGVASHLPPDRRAISADELAAREIDATAARITGDGTIVTAGIERRARERAEAAARPSEAQVAKAKKEAAAIAARICAA